MVAQLSIINYHLESIIIIIITAGYGNGYGWSYLWREHSSRSQSSKRGEAFNLFVFSVACLLGSWCPLIQGGNYHTFLFLKIGARLAVSVCTKSGEVANEMKRN